MATTRQTMRMRTAVLWAMWVAGVGRAQVLPVPQKYQEQDKWCWAGGSQAILDYYGVARSQTTIALYGTGGANVWNYCYGEGEASDGIYRRGINLILNHFGRIQCVAHNSSISFATSQAEIADGRPVLVNWQWDSGGAHLVVLRGLVGNTAYLMDPWNGPTVNTFAWTQRGGGHAWTYSLRLTTTPGDACEPDNSAAKAKLINNTQVQSRSIHAAGNVDWAKFVVRGTGARKVYLETAGTAGDTQLWLIKGSSGAKLAYDDDSGTGTFSRIHVDALTPGTYYLLIQEYGNNGVIPAYTLRANWATQYANGDAYEPDNTASAAKAIANGQTQIRAIHAVGNVDWAKFVVGASRALNVVVETAGAAGDTQLWVFKGSNGAQMGYDDHSGAGDFSRIAIAALPPGTYFVKVQENGNNGTIPTYTLRATWTSP